MRRHISIIFGQGLAIVLMVGFLIGFSPAMFASNCAFADGTDNFDDNSMEQSKWVDLPGEKKGQGQLNEINGRLEYTTSGGNAKDSMDRKWILTEFPYDGNWSIEITVTNNSIFLESNKWSSFGINVRSKMDQNDEIEIELAAMMNGAKMFWSEFQDNNVVVGEAFQSTTLASAPIRLSFNSALKVFNVSYYDGGWNSFGSFDVNASGVGTNGSANWGMANTDKFVAYVFGYSENMVVNSGVIYGDDFSETGGIEPPPPVLSASTGSVGSVVTIDGSGFGDNKGSVSIGDASTLMNAMADTASAAAVVKPAKAKITGWNDSSISFTLSKALPPGTYDVIINPKVKPSEPIVMYDAFTVTSPVLLSVPDIGQPEQEITIEGSFFGTKKGKVYLEYTEGTNIKKKTCKVTEWSMYNTANGDSRIRFIVPKLTKTFTGGDYTLKVVNKIGYAELPFFVGLAPSDRNLKENVTPIDGKEVLTRLAGIPVSSWNYKNQGPSIRHIGPMAQDFKSAFNVGESDRFINMVDSGGVALASIQGLYSILQDKDKEIRSLKNENLELKEEIRDIGKRLAAIENQIPK
jgi:hypothetical protein